jgi:murein DD-endopeptidase MepM/ murein hydrolase activator NlpD
MLSRRALLAGGAAALGSTVVARQRTGASTPTSIEGAATATRPAVRLRRSGGLLFPMTPTPRCVVLNNFGDPRSGGRFHEGIDLLATLGQEVYAVAPGVLVSQANATASLSGNAWGHTADDGQYYFYAHLSAFADGLSVGDRVSRGQVIGYVGDTGNPGPGNHHLHFEVHPGGMRSAAVDPLPLLDISFACTIY